MKRHTLFAPVAFTIMALLFWLNVLLYHRLYRATDIDVFTAVGVSLSAGSLWWVEWRARNTGG